MEKKKISAKQGKRFSNEVSEKRYSKSKFKKQVKEESQKTIEKKQFIVKKKQECKIEEKYNFSGELISTRCGITKYSSLQRKGYSIIPKGQCVIAEIFKSDLKARIHTSDGRVGIIYACDLKKMNFVA